MANKAKQTTCGIKKYVTDRQTDRQTNEFILGLTDPRPQSRENRNLNSQSFPCKKKQRKI
jgi:hypothetical protein